MDATMVLHKGAKKDEMKVKRRDNLMVLLLEQMRDRMMDRKSGTIRALELEMSLESLLAIS
jgi:hypothetical protein